MTPISEKPWDKIDLEFANSEAAHNIKDVANKHIIERLLEKVTELAEYELKWKEHLAKLKSDNSQSNKT